MTLLFHPNSNALQLFSKHYFNPFLFFLVMKNLVDIILYIYVYIYIHTKYIYTQNYWFNDTYSFDVEGLLKHNSCNFFSSLVDPHSWKCKALALNSHDLPLSDPNSYFSSCCPTTFIEELYILVKLICTLFFFAFWDFFPLAFAYAAPHLNF